MRFFFHVHIFLPTFSFASYGGNFSKFREFLEISDHRGYGHVYYDHDQIDQYQVQYRFGTVYPSKMFQYTILSYNRIQMRLAVILSILARAFTSQRRKAKTMKLRPKMGIFGQYFENCRFWLQKVIKIEIRFYILILQVILII